MTNSAETRHCFCGFINYLLQWCLCGIVSQLATMQNAMIFQLKETVQVL
jgi:hypothetical protein